jgi:hypothetical protein
MKVEINFVHFSYQISGKIIVLSLLFLKGKLNIPSAKYGKGDIENNKVKKFNIKNIKIILYKKNKFVILYKRINYIIFFVNGNLRKEFK